MVASRVQPRVKGRQYFSRFAIQLSGSRSSMWPGPLSREEEIVVEVLQQIQGPTTYANLIELTGLNQYALTAAITKLNRRGMLLFPRLSGGE